MIEGKIIVNATALDKGGALSILLQFLDSIPESGYEYIVFISPVLRLKVSRNNVTLIPVRINSFIGRFIWDSFCIKRWIRLHNLRPVATISLQNTNFRTKRSLPNFIYFHNYIPLSDAKWNLFRKEQRILWFYKYIYPIFVRIYLNSKTEVFVQSSFVKDSFAKRFHFPFRRIHVIVPKFRVLENKRGILDGINVDKNKLNLFYPATTYVFKNHATIIEALTGLDRAVQEKICLILTCDKEDLEHIISNKHFHFHFHINFLGILDYDKIDYLYKTTDALVFPSFIETLGLPLIEAASFGKKIIVSDLPYSHEALADYTGVTFVPYNDSDKWGKEIVKLFSQKGIHYNPYTPDFSNSWQELFNIIEKRISLS
jgi:glycosyltransferase involved in cell wall biosynthesis